MIHVTVGESCDSLRLVKQMEQTRIEEEKDVHEGRLYVVEE